MWSNLKVRRLFREDDGVEGCGPFRKKSDNKYHVLGNVLRIVFQMALSPVLLLTPRSIVNAVDNYLRDGWLVEFATTPDSVLSAARGSGAGEYDVTGLKPSWILQVTISGGTLQYYHQIPFSEDVENTGYTALSYPMKSAAKLFEEAGLIAGPAPEGREYTLLDCERIAEQLLRAYCSADWHLRGLLLGSCQ
ncbi:hypothetical protein C8R44DRAFT_913724 [Mycena epipterygia]|nr:hypothetical protein C8R44DRAFT_913724 [Mycena epipterygia]